MLLFAAKTGQLQPKRVDPYGCGFDAVTKSRFPRTTVFGSLRALSPSYGERWFALATSLLLAFLSLLVLTARAEYGHGMAQYGQKYRALDILAVGRRTFAATYHGHGLRLWTAIADPPIVLHQSTYFYSEGNIQPAYVWPSA